jgi:hypothetical protein
MFHAPLRYKFSIQRVFGSVLTSAAHTGNENKKGISVKGQANIWK